jgi:hypothetical protein
MFHRLLSRLAVSVSLALITLAVVVVLVTPSASAQSDLSIALTKSGGTLTSANQQVTVTVPSGVVKQPVTVTVSANVSQTIPGRFTVLGSAFTIEVQGSTTISLQITVHYTLPAGVNEKDLVIVYYDTVAGKWLPLSTTVDMSSHLAIATTAQVAQFVLISRSAITSLPPGAVIVDDRDAGFNKFGPVNYWHSEYTTTQGFWANYMYWTYVTNTVRNNYATWTPVLTPGTYDVYAFIASYNTNTDNARYQIVHQGTTTVRPIQQSPYVAEWVKLGTFYFGSGSGNYVLLDDLTYETAKHIGFDAIAFVPNKVYLPLVMNNYWTPPPQPAPKDFSGMHMGNRNGDDWTNDMLRPFDPTQGGAWPKIAVALSHQLFTVNRDANCHITNVSINPKGQNLYNYLKRAAQQNNTMVMIRIYPSPGNFQESIDPNWPDLNTRPRGRTLITQVGVHPDPAHWTQCQGYDQNRFRSVDDIGDEILAIQRKTHEQGWDVFGFEPANEPNAEWYANPQQPDTPPIPPYYEKGSWQAMDPYFANLYDYVHANAGTLTIRVFTPPMAQGANAETGNTGAVQGGCQPFAFSGYEQMPLTFNSGGPKNDGYSWHNYFLQGREAWATCPTGQHVSLYFPEPMSSNIQYHRRSAIMSEVDLAPPQMQWNNPVTDKNAQADVAAASIQKFLHDDYAVEYAAVWLLNDNNFNSSDYAKHAWSEAYDSFSGIRAWFLKWWYGSEYP